MTGLRRRKQPSASLMTMRAIIDDIQITRALHVVFVAHWIGGVALVTLVALPLARASGDAEKGWTLFEAIETRFAAQICVS